MPIPAPSEKDDKKSFISRCMSDSVMQKDYKDIKQRYAICIGKWDDKKTKASSVITAAGNEFITIDKPSEE